MQEVIRPPSTSTPAVAKETGVLTAIWQRWFTDLANYINQSASNAAEVEAGTLSTTITLAKLTGGGTNGSATFTNGLLTSYTPPT